MSNSKKYLLIITGPTGIGKTELSVRLAGYFNTEIISCDSRQMYREMKIGTAVPSSEQMAGIPHHFIGNLSIHDYYNVFHYETDVLNLLNKLYSTTDIVILCGGSGLYLDAVLQGMDDIPDPDPAIRQELNERLEQEGIERLVNELRDLDPEYYDEVDINNPKRILRGLEVWYTTGQKFSSFRIRRDTRRSFVPMLVNLDLEREKLYNRINLRVDRMVEQGLEQEARDLYPWKSLNALKTVGYKEWFDYFEGLYSAGEAIRLIKRNSRHYAKRQITWNKKYKGMLSVSPDSIEEIIQWVSNQMLLSG